MSTKSVLRRMIATTLTISLATTFTPMAHATEETVTTTTEAAEATNAEAADESTTTAEPSEDADATTTEVAEEADAVEPLPDLRATVGTTTINDPTCELTEAHPNPVLLIHGTSLNVESMKDVAATLSDQGACVWGFNYGKGTAVSIQKASDSLYAYGNLDASAQELATNVDTVLAQTGAEKVDLVGHSQGGMLTKVFISKMGHGDKVDHVVALGAPFHGTNLGGFSPVVSFLYKFLPRLMTFFLSEASVQQMAESDFFTDLNSYPDTVEGVTYTSIYSPNDTLVTPNSTSQLEGNNAVNLDLKTTCDLDVKVSHDNLLTNPESLGLVAWAVSRDHDDTQAPAQCVA